MTTIVAVRGAGMFSDSRVSSSGTVPFDGVKLFRVRGAIIGCAGSMEQALRFVEWYKSKTKKLPKMRDLEALVLTKHELRFYGNGNERGCEIVSPYYSIGSGHIPMMALLKAGIAASDAYKYVAEVDPYTGGPVRFEAL
jgi:hypothetical protein